MSHLDEGTLHTFLDGELDAAEEVELREHLATCAECRARLDVERETRRRAHEILRYADPVGIVPPDFDELRARASSRAGPAPGTSRTRSSVRPLILPWAASIVLAVGVGWFAQTLLTGSGGAGSRVAIDSEQARESEPAPLAAGPTLEEEPSAASTTATDARVAAAPASARSAPEPQAAPGGGGDSGARSLRTAPDAAALGAPAEGAATMAGRGRAGGEAPPDEQPTLALESAAAAQEPERALPETVALEAITVADASKAADAEDTARADRVLGFQAPREMAAPPSSVAARIAAPAATVPADSLARRYWVGADASEAANALGSPPLVFSRLPVIGYAIAADTTGLVRATQQLPGGEPLEIYQWRDARAAGEIEVVVRAAVPADSLARLREAIGRGER